MTIYNGFADGETRSHTMPVRKEDQGHSMVKMTTTRLGSAFAFSHRATCQCGKVFATKRDRSGLLYRHEAHIKKETTNG